MNVLQVLRSFVKTNFMSGIQKDLEILALRSQLAMLQKHIISRKITKPRVTNRFRKLWIFLSRNMPGWKDVLILVKPETVIGWHKRAFRVYWRRKSNGGRPKVSPSAIALIKRIHRENQTHSPEKIHERLVALNVTDAPAPNTIAK